MSQKETERAAQVGVKAAAAAFKKPAAVVVVVRDLAGGLSVASNVVSDRAALLRILKEGGDAVRGDGIAIV